jgi:type I restriction-modification system DNA methylase subunit
MAFGASPSPEESAGVVKSYRDSGAPIVVLSVRENAEIWRQGAETPECKVTLPARQLSVYIVEHKQELSPQAVYRAKNLGQVNDQYQMEFVDAGFMPFLERNVGEKLGKLLTSVVADVMPAWERVQGSTLQDSDLLLRSVFRLLAGKILRDKEVRKFKSLSASDPSDVLRLVTEHCGGVSDEDAFRRDALNVLAGAGTRIFELSSLRDMSTESLGVIYESAFISKETREKLGTHSTPPWLADYMMWQVEDWFKEIPAEERIVYEPACGHGAFLVAALRMLQQFAFEEKIPYEKTAPYLRKMLYGADIDVFSLEIARLSLSLTDIPNPDGWNLPPMNLFAEDPFAKQVPPPALVLTNPPYEAFKEQERLEWKCAQYTKYAEILARTLPHIRENGIIGVIAPCSFLTRHSETDIRKTLATNFEIREINLFPDNVFKFSKAETCVLLARRKAPHSNSITRYGNLTKKGMDAFRKGYQFENNQEALIAEVVHAPDYVFHLPLLSKLWRSLAHNPKLADLADIGRGIEFKKGCPVKRGGRSREILRHVDSGLLHHQEPVPEKLVFSEDDVRFWGTAAETSIPQIIVNASPVHGTPWPVWALMDRHGLLTSKRLITVRPNGKELPCSIELLWALLTSPLANAFVHAMSDKRDIDTQTYEAIPLPHLRDLCNSGAVVRAVKRYVEKALAAEGLALRTQALDEELKQLRLQVDAEVLKLYDLAPRDERKLLDLFSGHKRAGVPFEQTEYFSRDFTPFIPLHEYLSPEFKRSTAGEIRKIDFAKVLSPEFKAAMRRAVELYSDEE